MIGGGAMLYEAQRLRDCRVRSPYTPRHGPSLCLSLLLLLVALQGDSLYRTRRDWKVAAEKYDFTRRRGRRTIEPLLPTICNPKKSQSLADVLTLAGGQKAGAHQTFCDHDSTAMLNLLKHAAALRRAESSDPDNYLSSSSSFDGYQIGGSFTALLTSEADDLSEDVESSQSVGRVGGESVGVDKGVGKDVDVGTGEEKSEQKAVNLRLQRGHKLTSGSPGKRLSEKKARHERDRKLGDIADRTALLMSTALSLFGLQRTLYDADRRTLVTRCQDARKPPAYRRAIAPYLKPFSLDNRNLFPRLPPLLFLQEKSPSMDGSLPVELPLREAIPPLWEEVILPMRSIESHGGKRARRVGWPGEKSSASGWTSPEHPFLFSEDTCFATDLALTTIRYQGLLKGDPKRELRCRWIYWHIVVDLAPTSAESKAVALAADIPQPVSDVGPSPNLYSLEFFLFGNARPYTIQLKKNKLLKKTLVLSILSDCPRDTAVLTHEPFGNVAISANYEIGAADVDSFEPPPLVAVATAEILVPNNA